MRIKRFGVEIPLAPGQRPKVEMIVYYDQRPVLLGRMKRDHLPCRAPLTDAMRTLLEQNPCRQGQRTPRRLRLNWFDRRPDRFFSLSAHSAGIEIPENGSLHALAIELHIAAPTPLLPWPVLFHFQGAEPVPKRWGGLRWVLQPWLPICPRAFRGFERTVSPSGQVIDLRISF